MKRRLAGPILAVALTVLVPLTASAQRGGFAGRGGGSVGRGGMGAGPPRGAFSSPQVFNPVQPRLGLGFGNVVSPSGIRPSSGILNPTFSPNTLFPSRLGATIAGNTGFFTGNRRTGLIYPVIVGSYGYGGYGYGEMAPQVTIINNPPPQSPVVIVNDSYNPPLPANPVVREVAVDPSGRVTNNEVRVIRAPAPSNPEGDPISVAQRSAAVRSTPGEPTVYLLAMEDGSVYSAYAYWVEGEMLHYITTKYAHNQASTDQLDLPVTTQLNRERGIEFDLR